ncbi:hypothetical protein [Micromonospora sp. WMMD812]|uniref:hypothetical protein n=1 Tax=Micromonospora sp. WMMD812 TaxID=3015152 RepID=UPI00248C6117|nr:hypothetical protein [Micromonospora sp. WMMD812]WBB69094.1 hypothetical protein O7603_07020 [Micromonospora sp. WMMD812]
MGEQTGSRSASLFWVGAGTNRATLTRDTYQSVVKRLHREAATAVAGRIKNTRRRTA